MQKLNEIEDEIWSSVKCQRTSFFVEIPLNTSKEGSTQETKIWTTLLEQNNVSDTATHIIDKSPIVLLHGLCASSPIWVLNVDSLVTTTCRKIYVLDLLGFGKSSRIKFRTDATAAENLHIHGIEAWRTQLDLNRIIVVGHSFGGFLAGCYAIKFPERVEHLIFVDPWGFPEKPLLVDGIFPVKRTFGVRMAEVVAQYTTPMATIRLAGRFGPWLLRRYRQDLLTPFSHFNTFAEYWCLINAQNPTGEVAYLYMMDQVAWAKFPLCKRRHKFPSSMKVSFIFGGKSWLNQSWVEDIKLWMAHISDVEIHIIENGGHHVYADDPASFCRIVTERISKC